MDVQCQVPVADPWSDPRILQREILNRLLHEIIYLLSLVITARFRPLSTPTPNLILSAFRFFKIAEVFVVDSSAPKWYVHRFTPISRTLIPSVVPEADPLTCAFASRSSKCPSRLASFECGSLLMTSWRLCVTRAVNPVPLEEYATRSAPKTVVGT